MPDWIETFRMVGTLLVWLVLPVQILMIWRSHRQFTQWQEGEKRRVEHWVQEMEAAGRMREEAAALRAQAEAASARLYPDKDRPAEHP